MKFTDRKTLGTLVAFGLIGRFMLLFGIGLIWSSEVYHHERLTSRGVRARSWSVDWDSRAFTPAGKGHGDSYVNLTVDYETLDGARLASHVSLSPEDYTQFSQGSGPLDETGASLIRFLYLEESPGSTLLLPYEKPRLANFRIGWVLALVGGAGAACGLIAKLALTRR